MKHGDVVAGADGARADLDEAAAGEGDPFPEHLSECADTSVATSPTSADGCGTRMVSPQHRTLREYLAIQ
ncbi:hypothetical protein GCM10018791_08590 [Streptomyces zaomyceticus]|nr:hypothetical protein GCM10018791_08590 [Streptomyces zaomyceticus]